MADGAMYKRRCCRVKMRFSAGKGVVSTSMERSNKVTGTPLDRMTKRTESSFRLQTGIFPKEVDVYNVKFC